MLLVNEFQITEDDFRTVQEVVYKHCGISLGNEKQAMVRARLARQIREGGFNSAADYLNHALADRLSNAFSGLIDSITTNLTSFFREKEHFNFLSDVTLPNLLKQKIEKGDGRLLIWSAACSTGEEPYTIAMTVLDTISRLRLSSYKIDVRILATDISTKVLDVAQRGTYDDERMSGISPAFREKYFRVTTGPDGSSKNVVKEELRSPIRFRHLNLLGPWPFKGPFDFIFCRNVMIYFDKQTQQTLIDRMTECLCPEGLFFTGHSESLTRINHRFINRIPSVYQKSL